MVNASKNVSWSSRLRLLLPWLGEVLTLKAVNDLMYDNTTTHRRRGLVEQFDRAEREGTGPRGTLLVMMEQSLRKMAGFFAKTTDCPDRSARAKAALQKLDACPELDWDAMARKNADVATTLRSLGTERSVDLLHHGYVLAIWNAHVILGYPPLDMPCRERFRGLVS